MDKCCFTCEYFDEPFGYLEEGCRCKNTGQYTRSDKVCENHTPASQQFLDFEKEDE